MCKFSCFVTLSVLFWVNSVSGQDRNDWPEIDSFSGTAVAYNPQTIPWICWDALIYKATHGTKVDELGPLGLTESEKKDLAWLHFRKRQEYEALITAADDDQAWLRMLEKAPPDERAKLIEQRNAMFDATGDLDVEMAKQFSKTLAGGIFEDLNNEQRKLATDFAVGELLNKVPAEQLFRQLQKSGFLEMSPDEQKRLWEEIKEEQRIADQEIARIRARFWTKIVSLLPDKERKKIESALLVTEPSKAFGR